MSASDSLTPESLLPCPFCGKIPDVENGLGHETHVVCRTPMCALESAPYCDERAWNRRTASETPSAHASVLSAKMNAYSNAMAECLKSEHRDSGASSARTCFEIRDAINKLFIGVMKEHAQQPVPTEGTKK